MYATSAPRIKIENLTKLLFSTRVFKKEDKNRRVETRVLIGVKTDLLPMKSKGHLE